MKKSDINKKELQKTDQAMFEGKLFPDGIDLKRPGNVSKENWIKYINFIKEAPPELIQFHFNEILDNAFKGLEILNKFSALESSSRLIYLKEMAFKEDYKVIKANYIFLKWNQQLSPNGLKGLFKWFKSDYHIDINWSEFQVIFSGNSLPKSSPYKPCIIVGLRIEFAYIINKLIGLKGRTFDKIKEEEKFILVNPSSYQISIAASFIVVDKNENDQLSIESPLVDQNRYLLGNLSEPWQKILIEKKRNTSALTSGGLSTERVEKINRIIESIIKM